MRRQEWRKWLATTVAIAAIVLAAPLPAAARTTDDRSSAPLGSLLLRDQDVPDAYQRIGDLAAPLGKLLQQFGVQVPAATPALDYPSHVRLWQGKTEGGIFVLATRYPRDSAAAAALCGARTAAEDRGSATFAIQGLPDARGYVVHPQGVAGAVLHLVVFRQGRVSFMVRTGPEPGSDDELVGFLARRQAARAPAGPTFERCALGRWERGGRLVGAAYGVVGIYLAGVWAVARVRDPLRRRLRHRHDGSPAPTAERAHDVNEVAGSARRRAAFRAGLQLLGIFLADAALVPFLWPEAASYAVLGLIVGVVVPRVMLGGSRSQWRFPAGVQFRGRLILAAVTGILAAALLGMGLFSLLGSALLSVNDPTPEELGADPETVQALALPFGVGLLALGSVLWILTRRIAAARARDLLERDTRRPVLFLRSFGDDGLRIRIAIYGRAALLKRLAPRRFARFEEIVARRLGSAGPVIAVNRPGTRLPPLGAARESLSDETWQAEVAEWMDAAACIAVAAAPLTVPNGLGWELAQISERGLWHKTMLILPPVPAHELRARWARFVKVLADVVPIDGPLDVDAAAVLVCRLSPDGVLMAVTSMRRDEWSYAAAFDTALAEIGAERIQSID